MILLRLQRNVKSGGAATKSASILIQSFKARRHVSKSGSYADKLNKYLSYKSNLIRLYNPILRGLPFISGSPRSIFLLCILSHEIKVVRQRYGILWCNVFAPPTKRMESTGKGSFDSILYSPEDPASVVPLRLLS